MLIKSKKLSRGNRLTIPKDLISIFGLHFGQAVDLLETDDGILVRKHVPTCFCCGGIEKVNRFKRFEICEACREELKNG